MKFVLVAILTVYVITLTIANVEIPGSEAFFELTTASIEGRTIPAPSGLLYPRESESREVYFIKSQFT